MTHAGRIRGPAEGWTRRAAIGSIAAAPFAASAALASGAPFRGLAPTPPMGWNSWDSFATTLDEEQARTVAAIMARQLLPAGYDIFTIDAQWFEPGATGFQYRDHAALTMDGHGRLMPAPNRYPSAAGGAGFGPFADHIHGLGLKLGIHLMRGVPRLAADRKLPILGSSHHCGEIADRVNVCEWNSDNYGIDMSKPGAQAYYDSVFRLIASWKVDLVKVDDMSRPYHRNEPEIEAVRRAIDRSGRPMILSLSPGATPLDVHAHVAAHANMWRISDDFWDDWKLLEAQFERLADWAPYRLSGAWPDADMLPLGLLALGTRRTRFTPDEQRTLMTLWSIARSPLIMGGDLRALDPATLALLTNKEVIAVNQASEDGHQLFRTADQVGWAAREPRTGDRYVALFNLGEQPAPVTVPLDALGFRRGVSVRDLWSGSAVGTRRGALSATLPAHGAALYRLAAA